MRILHVTPFHEPAWGYGGMARASAALARALAGRGHEVTVVTARLDARHPADAVEGGVRVRRLPGPSWLARALLPFGRGLADVLDGGSWDVAHLHGHRSPLVIAAARRLRRAGVPFLLQPHGTFPAHGRHAVAKRALDRLAAGRVVSGAASLIAVSRAEAALLPRASEVVPNGVAAVGAPARPPGPRSGLLFVGSDAPQKRAAAACALLDLLPGTTLDLVGRFGPGFRRRARRWGARVRVRGVLDPEALAAAYAAAAVVVHPAVGEGFGLVPFEAALAGCPAVAADDGGPGEWFRAAGGCLVAPDDGPALAAAAARRIARPGLSAAEAAAVAAYARANLTWEGAAEAVERACLRVVAGPGGLV